MQTRASLLIRIRDARDHVAWSEFVRLYAPLLHAYAMKHGLQDADAADLTQDALSNVMRAAAGFVYDPARGSFRGWLLTIARNQIRKFANRRAQTAAAGGSEAQQMLAEHPGAMDGDVDWDRDYQMRVFHWAAQRVQPEFRDKSWQAFWRTVVLHEEVEPVAKELEISAGAVYIARSRITTRIRQEIQSIEENDA